MERETYQDSPEHSSYDLDQLSLGSDAEDESAEHYDFHEEFLSCDPKRIQLAHKLAKKIRRDERKLSSKLPTTSKEKQISVKKPYKDRQQGSLCRMHALNAFYGEPRLTPKKFFNLCMQFDHRQGYSEPISREYFYVESDGMNIISWIVEKDPRFKTLYMSAGKTVLMMLSCLFAELLSCRIIIDDQRR